MAKKIRQLQAESGSTIVVGSEISLSADVLLCRDKGGEAVSEATSLLVEGPRPLHQLSTAITFSKGANRLISCSLVLAFLFNMLAIPLSMGSLWAPFAIDSALAPPSWFRLTPCLGKNVLCLGMAMVIASSLSLRSWFP